jgi:signal transduction histidine kinase
MIMKRLGSFGLLYLFHLLACGQAQKNPAISSADSVKVRFYESRSIFFQNKMPDSAIYFADKGLKLSKKLHYSLGKGLMLNRLAEINSQYGNVKLALKYQKEALKIFNSLGNPIVSTDATANLGFLEGKAGNFKAGIDLIKGSLNQYQKRKDTTGMIKAYTRLAELTELTGDLNKAVHYYAIAEKLNEGKPISDDYLALINNLGKINVKRGNHPEALSYYEIGIIKSRKSKRIKEHISFLNHAGKALDAMGNKQKAFNYHQEGLQSAKTAELPEEEARSMIAIATALKNEDANLSIAHLKTALKIARAIGNKELSSEIYQSLSGIYRQQSRYEEALIALEKHHYLLDSMRNAEKGHKIAVLQNSYELAESRLHIETLELTNKEKTYQRNLSLLSALAVLIILVVLGLYFFKTNRLNKRLQESNHTKDKLFSIIGHDLRNPIGGITQLLAIMDEQELTAEEHQHMVSEMRKQGNVTLEILNALLNWGEAQLKGVHIKPSNFNAGTVVSKNITALRKQADDKAIVIINQAPDELMVYGDMNHFDFIIRNLLSNAIKFSLPSGKIEINAKTDKGSDRVIFAVKDYGKGISKTQQDLFLKSTLDISFGTNGEKGTGIGLMLSKEFISANHEQIWIKSEEGNGATFYFTFHKN